MNNLFSIFDPTSSVFFCPNWLAGGCILIFLPPNFWAAPGRALNGGFVAPVAAMGEFRAVSRALAAPGAMLFSCRLFFYLLISNLLGLLPFVFTNSRHLVFTLSLALPVWLGYMLLSLQRSRSLTLAHFVPLGSPLALAPFMVLIELTSSLIRPLTLAVRLAANMVAGHLLLCLLSSPLTAASASVVALVSLALVALLALESAVALIQAFVFSILASLYTQEAESPFL